MSDSAKTAQRTVAVVLAAALVAVSAQASVPVWGSEVPQSLQTLTVLVVAALLGPRLGALSVVLYLMMGATGLPVFADGAAGVRHLVGPTSGYLLGFVCAAATVGYAARLRPHGVADLIAFMVLGHVIILALGWTRLALTIGPSEALVRGVVPFVWGGVVKSIAAAVVVVLCRRATVK